MKLFNGTAHISSVRVDDATGCAVGRVAPRWCSIVFLVLGGCVCFIAVELTQRENANNSRYEDDRTPLSAVILIVFGVFFMIAAICLYAFRETAIHFLVKGSTAANGSLFTTKISSREQALKVHDNFAALKHARAQVDCQHVAMSSGALGPQVAERPHMLAVPV
eukprot:CAMPEP_0173420196 /NCGR_PEP_ID=MMETSP1357-20121228/1785_1 /TAXON_ID=77926 /ORGANISM="Hemiselmis rufescens, Strain PCC563" /LENGTH=163 /DNA_ID=CAMNT_0014382963 /DNA_START=252 /DNA_END=743 /DNA_ORIENTATION=+